MERQTPSHNQVFMPLYGLLSDQKEHHIVNLIEKMAMHFDLSEAQKNQIMEVAKEQSNMTIKLFDQHVNIALNNLVAMEYLDPVEGGLALNVHYERVFKLTDKGLHFYQVNRNLGDAEFLAAFKLEWKEIISSKFGL